MTSPSIPSASSDITDLLTGKPSRVWYRFFFDLFTLTGTGANITGGQINGTPIGTTTPAVGEFTTVQVTTPSGYIASDDSVGISTTITTASLVGKTITVKDGLIVGFA